MIDYMPGRLGGASGAEGATTGEPVPPPAPSGGSGGVGFLSPLFGGRYPGAVGSNGAGAVVDTGVTGTSTGRGNTAVLPRV